MKTCIMLKYPSCVHMSRANGCHEEPTRCEQTQAICMNNHIRSIHSMEQDLQLSIWQQILLAKVNSATK